MPEATSDSPLADQVTQNEDTAEDEVPQETKGDDEKKGDEKKEEEEEVEVEEQVVGPVTYHSILVMAFYAFSVVCCFLYTKNTLLSGLSIASIIASAFLLKANISAYVTLGIVTMNYGLSQYDTILQNLTPASSGISV